MALPKDLPEQLQGLTRLAQDNKLEMRTVLLRVMTDLYLSRPHHTADEVRQYEEIFLGLLPHVDEAGRMVIAGKLAADAGTPESVLVALIQAGGPAAAEVLARSPVLSRKTLLRAAMHGDDAMTMALASRMDLDEMIVTGLASRAQVGVMIALARNPGAPISREVFRLMATHGRSNPDLGRALCQRNPDQRDLGPLFLWASHLQRASVLLDAKTSVLASLESREPNEVERATADEMEQAAISGDWILFSMILARGLKCSLPQAQIIMEDRQGEPLVLALGALFLTPEQVTRVLMCQGAPVTHPYERIQSLIALRRQLPRPVCARLMRDMLGRHATDDEQRGTHVTIADQGAADLAARPLRQEHQDVSHARRQGPLFLGRRA